MDFEVLDAIAQSEYGVPFDQIEDEDIYQYILEKAERYKKGKLRKFEVILKCPNRNTVSHTEIYAHDPDEAKRKVESRHKRKAVLVREVE
jgi:hypothetical protein